MKKDVAEAIRYFAEAGEAFPYMTVPEFVQAQCARHAERIAIEVIESGVTLTYADLHKRILATAVVLAADGVGPGDRVALQLRNGWEYPVIWLALAQLGAVHVPVNTRYTPEEIRHVLEDSGAHLLIHADDLSIMEGIAVNTSCLSEFMARTVAEEIPPFPAIAPHDLLNIQYTSGTTGLPKGCMLSHDYWLVLARAAAIWDAEPVQRLLSAQPYFYMDPQWITLKTLLNGATMVIAPGLSVTRFLGWLLDYDIDWCMFPILMARQPLTGREGETSLRQAATFGWDPETCARFHTAYSVRSREGFGMTEIGLGTAMPASFEHMYQSASTGIAGPCRETSVRDAEGCEVPPGTEGELWVRGRSIFQGYWKRPDATATACPGDGWFRTGDLFRKDADGYHWITGRIKDMIRRSSENIAAREVEAALCSLPNVAEAAAIAEPDATRGEEVLAAIQLHDQTAEPCIESLVAGLEDCLASFKRPRYWTFVADVPRTASNKVQKPQLRDTLSGARAYDTTEDRWIMLK